MYVGPAGGTKVGPDLAGPGGRAELPAGGLHPGHISHLQAVTGGGRRPANRSPVSDHLTRAPANQGPPVRLTVGGDRRESGGNYYNSNFYNGDNQNITERERARESSVWRKDPRVRDILIIQGDNTR